MMVCKIKIFNMILHLSALTKKIRLGMDRVIPAGPLRENLDILKNYKNIFLNGNDNENTSFKKFL